MKVVSENLKWCTAVAGKKTVSILIPFWGLGDTSSHGQHVVVIPHIVIMLIKSICFRMSCITPAVVLVLGCLRRCEDHEGKKT